MCRNTSIAYSIYFLRVFFHVFAVKKVWWFEEKTSCSDWHIHPWDTTRMFASVGFLVSVISGVQWWLVVCNDLSVSIDTGGHTCHVVNVRRQELSHTLLGRYRILLPVIFINSLDIKGAQYIIRLHLSQDSACSLSLVIHALHEQWLLHMFMSKIHLPMIHILCYIAIIIFFIPS
jgi:hypothetical protein